MKDQKGFTLVEVMVSCMIFLIIGGILSSGNGFILNMKKKTFILVDQISAMGESLSWKEDCILGNVSLKLDEDREISKEGWLYCGKTCSLNGTSVEIIYVEPMEYEIPDAETESGTESNAKEEDTDDS